MSNTILAHRRLLAAGIGGLAALPSSVLMAAFSFFGANEGTEVFALVAPLTGIVLGLLLGAGVKPSPAPFPAARALAAGLLAVPLGALLMSPLLVGTLWTSDRLGALVEAALYGVAGVLWYGWFIAVLSLPSALVGAFVMQWLLGHAGAADMPPTADLRVAAS
jgi:fumarate reductase subunit D